MSKYLNLKASLLAVKLAFIVFAGVVGALGLFFMYASDDMIDSLYHAGFYCAIVSGLVKYIAVVSQQK